MLKLVSEFIPVASTFIAIAYISFVIVNRTDIERILLQNSLRKWHEKLEFIIFLGILNVLFFFPFFFPSDVPTILLSWAPTLLAILSVLSTIIIIFSFVLSIFFSTRKKDSVKSFMKWVVLIFWSSTSLLIWNVIVALKSEVFKSIKEENASDILYLFITSYILLYIIFKLSLFTLTFYNKRKKSFYKIELIESAKINDVLSSLRLDFALDNERLVMREIAPQGRLSEQEAYIFYSKEKLLYKYSKDKSSDISKPNKKANG